MQKKTDRARTKHHKSANLIQYLCSIPDLKIKLNPIPNSEASEEKGLSCCCAWCNPPKIVLRVLIWLHFFTRTVVKMYRLDEGFPENWKGGGNMWRATQPRVCIQR